MPTLSLSMIVRDAEPDLANCLASVKGAVDEIVIADTGSKDRSIALARDFGAAVFSIPWTNDFAEARNRSLEAVQSDWVLVLDADEQINSADAGRLRSCLDANSADGYLVSIRNYVNTLSERVWDKPALPNQHPPEFARQYPGYIDHQNVRLFKRRSDIFFTGRVHETVGHRIQAIGGRLRSANFLIHHHGLAAGQEIKARKNQLYRDLGRAKVVDNPTDAQAHFELGVLELDAFHNYEEALRLFEAALALKPEFGEAWLFAGLSLLRLSREREALPRLQRARQLRHAPSLGAELQGDAHFCLKDFGAAMAYYKEALKLRGTSSALEGKLAISELQSGNPAKAIARLEKCLRRDPVNPEVHDRLITVLVAAGDWERAALAAETKIVNVIPDEKSYLRAASIRARLQQWKKTLELLKEGLEAFPDAPKLNEAYREAVAHQSRTGQPREIVHFLLKPTEPTPIR